MLFQQSCWTTKVVFLHQGYGCAKQLLALQNLWFQNLVTMVHQLLRPDELADQKSCHS
jgi:hypothetical protein